MVYEQDKLDPMSLLMVNERQARPSNRSANDLLMIFERDELDPAVGSAEPAAYQPYGLRKCAAMMHGQ